MNITFIGSPNYTEGRGGQKVTGCVILPNGKELLYDLADEGIVSLHKWQYSSGYARFQKETREDGKKVYERIYLHRLLLDAKKGQIVDHANGNTLDNRRSNLRLTDRSGNAANSKLSSRSTTGYRGVTKHKSGWVAQANYKSKHHYLGLFKTIEEAAQVADDFRKTNFKEFAR